MPKIVAFSIGPTNLCSVVGGLKLSHLLGFYKFNNNNQVLFNKLSIDIPYLIRMLIMCLTSNKYSTNNQ